MKLTATDLRKRLFSVLEDVTRGEIVEVTYKGASVRLSAASSKSKLARAKRQNTLLCDPDAIIQSDRATLEKMETEWRKDWRRI